MIDPKNFELADTVPFKETLKACAALNTALEAMAHNESDTHDIAVIATLYGVMRQEHARAYRAELKMQAARQEGGA